MFFNSSYSNSFGGQIEAHSFEWFGCWFNGWERFFTQLLWPETQKRKGWRKIPDWKRIDRLALLCQTVKKYSDFSRKGIKAKGFSLFPYSWLSRDLRNVKYYLCCCFSLIYMKVSNYGCPEEEEITLIFLPEANFRFRRLFKTGIGYSIVVVYH